MNTQEFEEVVDAASMTQLYMLSEMMLKEYIRRVGNSELILDPRLMRDMQDNVAFFGGMAHADLYRE